MKADFETNCLLRNKEKVIKTSEYGFLNLIKNWE
jgi:hypothetical protein